MYAFCLIHFGNKPKYLELEIYTIIMLKKNTKYDVVYLYSLNDTPTDFINVIKKYCDVIPYDDNGVTYNIKNFKSIYQHFNTLRTCNFLYAYQLVKYKKIAIIESDTIIVQNIDDIFKLKTPATLTFYDINKILENYKINIDVNKDLSECSKESHINGGVMVIKPSLSKYKLYLKNIEKVIKNNCIYPNETLFVISNKTIYNLPYKYNGVQFLLLKYSKMFNIDMKKYLSIIHLNHKEYKHVDIIRDKYLDRMKKDNLLYYFVKKFKDEYYDIYNKKISNLITL